jgi:predicted ATPase
MTTEQLKYIRIKGFKSIKDCELTLGDINIFIGSNGAGKSNFISIFRLLQNVIEKNLQNFVAENGGANALLYNGRKATEKIEIEFFFGNNSYDFILAPNDNDRLYFKYEGVGYDGTFYNRTMLGVGHPESVWDKVKRNEICGYVQPVLRRQRWRVYHFHDTSKNARVKQSCKITNNAELLYDAGNLSAFLFRLKTEYPNSYMDIVEVVRLIAPYFQDFYFEPRPFNDDTILRWKQKGCDDVFNANQFSDGTLRFVCLATLFLQPTELQPASIILDEPELGLHPFAISLLAELMRKAAVNKQVIAATQSVELLNEFAPENIVVVDRDENSSVFNKFTEEDLKDWLNDDYSLGDLWKKNILGGRP